MKCYSYRKRTNRDEARKNKGIIKEWFKNKTENMWHFPKHTVKESTDSDALRCEQDRQCKYNVILRRVRLTIVAVEKQ
jgi:hypothetical protein